MKNSPISLERLKVIPLAVFETALFIKPPPLAGVSDFVVASQRAAGPL